MFIGFGIACALGIPLGFFMGINKYFNAFFNPIFNLIKPMPPISWVSLSILWLGIGEEPKIFIIAIGAFVPIVLNAYNGIRLIDEELYDVVRMAGGGRMKEIVEVSFLAAVPSIFAGLQISLSGAWSCVLAAELVSARSGLGFVIVQGMNSGKASMVIAGMLLIALIASLCSYGIDSLEKKICPWRRRRPAPPRKDMSCEKPKSSVKASARPSFRRGIRRSMCSGTSPSTWGATSLSFAPGSAARPPCSA